MSGEEAKRLLDLYIERMERTGEALFPARGGWLREIARLLDEQEKAWEAHAHLLSALRRAAEAVPPTGHDAGCSCEVCWVQRDALLKGVALAFAWAVQLQPTELSRLRRVEEAARPFAKCRTGGTFGSCRDQRDNDLCAGCGLAAALDGKQEAGNG